MVSSPPWHERSDEDLLVHVQEGSHHAYTLLVERHATRFYRVAYRFLSNRALAEDIVQDAFLKLWEQPDMWKADRGARFTTWFHRIVVNRCLDSRRRITPISLPEDFPLADGAPAQDDVLAGRQTQQAVETAIHALPERQRTALNLCFYEGLSNQDAADVMGVHLKALQSLLMRAKTSLRARLKPHLPARDEAA